MLSVPCGCVRAWPTRQIELGDRDAVERIRRRAGHGLSAHAFASLFLWQATMGLSICLAEDAFFVRMASRGPCAWFFPCGAAGPKEDFLRSLSEQPDASLHYLREEDAAFLEACCPGVFTLLPARDDEEYLYLRSEQVALTGRAFKTLRAKVRRASRRDWQILPLDGDSLPLAEQVVRDWAALRGGGDEAVALLALEQFDALGMRGILLLQNGLPQATAFGSAITADTFDLHVTKTLEPRIDSFLKWSLFSRLPDSFVWINQEEDLGLEGLRTNKQDSLPARRTPLWKAVRA